MKVGYLVGKLSHDEFRSPELGKPMQVLERLVHKNWLCILTECSCEELADKIA